ncbi:TIGR04222 domain-containing membrane protein [Kitasatospora sp. NPDC054939]
MVWGFLVPLLVSAAVSAAAALRLRRARQALRRPEREARRPYRADVYELAFVAAHLPETLVTALHADGRLVASRAGTVTVTDGDPREPVEAAVALAAGPTRTHDLLDLLASVPFKAPHRAFEKQLMRTGLLQDDDLHARAVRAAGSLRTAAVLVAAAGGFSAWWAHRHDEGVLLRLLPFAALLAAAVVLAVRGRPERTFTTALGAGVLTKALADPAPRPPALAVALGGLAALPADHDLAIALAGSRAAAEAEQAARAARAAAERRRRAEAAARSRSASGSDGAGLGSPGGCGGSSCGGGCGGCGGGL